MSADPQDDSTETENNNIENKNLENMRQLRLKYPNNPFISFLNINSLRNKIIDVREIIKQTSPDYFVLAETKLNHEFPSAQFYIENYNILNRRDRNKFGGGLIAYAKKGVICKETKSLETANSEVICTELTISKKKWIIFTVYRPPNSSNLLNFFAELKQSLELAFGKYDNIIIMGDINIDIYNQSDAGYNKLKHLCDVYNLSNLIKGKTCFMKDHQSSIDVILTNKPKSFQHTTVFESGLSDYHLMISTSLKVKLVRLKSKVITYRCYKKFNQTDFLTDVQKESFNCNEGNANENYNKLVNTFRKIVDKHAPMKRKTLECNFSKKKICPEFPFNCNEGNATKRESSTFYD